MGLNCRILAVRVRVAVGAARQQVQQRTAQIKTSYELSWLALLGRLGRINWLRIFDNPKGPAIKYSDLTKACQISIIDLSDTDSPQVRNLVIADILRRVQDQQESCSTRQRENSLHSCGGHHRRSPRVPYGSPREANTPTV